MGEIFILRSPITRADLRAWLLDGSLVKAVVDCHARIMAVGGALHSDEESLLLDQGSSQGQLWGINLYPDDRSESWIEFDSMINLRPSWGNPTRGVEDADVRHTIQSIVRELVSDA